MNHSVSPPYTKHVEPVGITMVGPFPPPVHGMATVNEAVRRNLSGIGARVHVINLSSTNLSRSLLSRATRISKVLSGLCRLASMPAGKSTALYMSVSGGLGQIYEIAFLFVSRMKRVPLFLHHHSFAYVSKPKLLARLLFATAGNTATHVVLSPGMAKQISRLYGVSHMLPISNSVFLVEELATPRQTRNALRTVGFLGNISAEKGVFHFLRILHSLAQSQSSISGILAGPFQDESTKRRVDPVIAGLSNIKYVGAVYGADKYKFLASIDLLIFPSEYEHEADPIVVHEAMMHGVPIIAYARGCIPELLDSQSGKLIDAGADFAQSAIPHIESWIENPTDFARYSIGVRRRFEQIFERNQTEWLQLRRRLSLQAVGHHHQSD